MKTKLCELTVEQVNDEWAPIWKGCSASRRQQRTRRAPNVLCKSAAAADSQSPKWSLQVGGSSGLAEHQNNDILSKWQCRAGSNWQAAGSKWPMQTSASDRWHLSKKEVESVNDIKTNNGKGCLRSWRCTLWPGHNKIETEKSLDDMKNQLNNKKLLFLIITPVQSMTRSSWRPIKAKVLLCSPAPVLHSCQDLPLKESLRIKSCHLLSKPLRLQVIGGDQGHKVIGLGTCFPVRPVLFILLMLATNESQFPQFDGQRLTDVRLLAQLAKHRRYSSRRAKKTSEFEWSLGGIGQTSG